MVVCPSLLNKKDAEGYCRVRTGHSDSQMMLLFGSIYSQVVSSL